MTDAGTELFKEIAVQPGSRLSEMKDLLEKIITRGRSSPGKPQNNDVKVVRHPKKPVKRSKK